MNGDEIERNVNKRIHSITILNGNDLHIAPDFTISDAGIARAPVLKDHKFVTTKYHSMYGPVLNIDSTAMKKKSEYTLRVSCTGIDGKD